MPNDLKLNNFIKKNKGLKKKDLKKFLKNIAFENLNHSKVDHHRQYRKNFPEVILAEFKSTSEVLDIAKSLYKNGSNLFITRLKKKQAKKLKLKFPNARYNKKARTFFLQNSNSTTNLKVKNSANIIILTAGTSDLSVAEEAKETAFAFGIQAKIISDVGVAGIHRVLHYRKQIQNASVLIVIAGMDGALPSVVGGLSDTPLIAVPSSVGYGSNFSGLSALLAMLNSCSSGSTVVNIDNGFGAAYSACQIIRKFLKKK